MGTNIEELLQDILSELKELNSKLDSISSYGSYGISDVCDKIDEASTDVCGSVDDVKGLGIYNTIADIYDKLDE